MKNILLPLLILVTACQTTRINNVKYKVSPATTEIGSIGQSSSLFNLDNNYSTRSFPLLKNKIRLDIQIQPFTKDINKLYVSKVKSDQSGQKINYIDSIAVKPEFVTLSIMDISGFTNELNADYNKDITTYLKDTEDAVTITGLAIVLPKQSLEKIKNSDTYYLVNNQDKKYTIALYKNSAKTDILDLSEGTVLAYTLGKFCWALNDREEWYIGDIVKDNKSCKGNTRSRIKDKEQTSLFKM